MKKTIFIIGIILVVALLFQSCTGSPVGVYRADLTIMQSGAYTTITLNKNGSAEMVQKGEDPEYTWWDYAGKGKDVRIKTDYGWYYFMDFDEMMIYYGADDYRSCRNGNKFKKVK